jgi:aryl-alcohol dehydrogenase-like predicted oxidoreductase
MEAHMIAKQHHLIGPVMEQPQYNMFHRTKVELEFGQVYKTVGLGTTVWSPLASGILTGKHRDIKAAKGTRLTMAGLDWLRERELTPERLKTVEKLNKIADGLELSLPVMALAWCLKNPNVSTVILGASKDAQLKENLKASEAQDLLVPTVMEKIEKVLGNKPERPQW